MHKNSVVWIKTVLALATLGTTYVLQLTPLRNGMPEETLAPCGEICSYEVKLKEAGKYYPKVVKNINCRNVMLRMAWRKHQIVYPPLSIMPTHLRRLFLQEGKCNLKSLLYFNNMNGLKKDKKTREHNETTIQAYQDSIIRGGRYGYYDSRVMKDALEMFKKKLAHSTGFVVGTQSPWLEALLLNLNVSNITTLEYNNLKISHPKLTVANPYDFAERFLQGQVELFDFGASFSSIEHSGLGRYGDPLNPYGDMEAMAQAYCMLKPGGLYFLGIPFTDKENCYIEYNAHRVYTFERLKHVTANFNVLKVLRERSFHMVLVLQKN